MKQVIVGITGASGAIIGERLVRFLLEADVTVHAVVSPNAVEVFKAEHDLDLTGSFDAMQKKFMKHFGHSKKLHVVPCNDFAARISSGSAPIDAMVIAPCSLSTVGAIAAGITMNLIQRSASVSIKEKRPLVLVPRESPLSPIHLQNLLRLSEIGVHIVPATTAFYHRPKTVEEMVDFTIGRVLDILKIKHKLFTRWRELAQEE